jgi:hypothetical protein
VCIENRFSIVYSSENYRIFFLDVKELFQTDVIVQ